MLIKVSEQAIPKEDIRQVNEIGVRRKLEISTQPQLDQMLIRCFQFLFLVMPKNLYPKYPEKLFTNIYSNPSEKS